MPKILSSWHRLVCIGLRPMSLNDSCSGMSLSARSESHYRYPSRKPFQAGRYLTVKESLACSRTFGVNHPTILIDHESSVSRWRDHIIHDKPTWSCVLGAVTLALMQCARKSIRLRAFCEDTQTTVAKKRGLSFHHSHSHPLIHNLIDSRTSCPFFQCIQDIYCAPICHGL